MFDSSLPELRPAGRSPASGCVELLR